MEGISADEALEVFCYSSGLRHIGFVFGSTVMVYQGNHVAVNLLKEDAPRFGTVFGLQEGLEPVRALRE